MIMGYGIIAVPTRIVSEEYAIFKRKKIAADKINPCLNIGIHGRNILKNTAATVSKKLKFNNVKPIQLYTAIPRYSSYFSKS